ncbi:MAG: hypothetical protein ACE5HA_02050 [Anaerolineae bacterium]
MPLSRLLNLPFTPEQERLMWLAGSVLMYAVGTNAAWVFRRVKRWPAVRLVLVAVVRFVFYVGVPYTALLGGVVTFKSLGLVEAQQRRSLNQGVLIALGTVALLGLIGWHYKRQVSILGSETPQPLQAARSVLGRPWGWAFPLIDVGYQQIHWAFFRAVPLLVVDDLYTGAFLGLTLVFLEAYANPRVRRGLSNPTEAEVILLSAGFATLTTVLFILTGTSWLGASTHFAVILGLILLFRVRQSSQPREP